MLNNWFSKLTITIPLGWLLSHFFMWSNNVHMFTNRAFLYSSVLIVVVAIIMYFLGVFWLKISDIVPKKYKKSIDIGNAVLFAGAFSLIIGVFLMEPVLNLTSVKLPLVIFFVFMCFALYYIKHVFNTILVSMLVFSFTIFGFNLISLNMETVQAEETEAVQAKNLTVEFKEKPNIYLFWLESYHDFATQRDVYGIDTQPVQNFLNENDFVTYSHVYTDGHATLNAFAELYGMGFFQAKEAGISDATIATRELIGGSEYNLVLKTLKNNDYYTTQIFQGSDYYMTYAERSPYLDQTDTDEFYQPFYALFAPCYTFANHVDIDSYFNNSTQNTIVGNLFERVDIVMRNGLQSHQPFFVSFKGGAVHTNGVAGYTYQDVQSWLDDKTYNQHVDRGNNEMKEIVNNIIENDSNALIIIVSDHGACRLRGANQAATSMSELMQNLASVNISYEDYINDIFGGILAIRFPDGEQVDITDGHYLSQRNLFMHVFAYLSNDISLLEQRNVSESQFGHLIFTRDGEILYE